MVTRGMASNGSRIGRGSILRGNCMKLLYINWFPNYRGTFDMLFNVELGFIISTNNY